MIDPTAELAKLAQLESHFRDNDSPAYDSLGVLACQAARGYLREIIALRQELAAANAQLTQSEAAEWAKVRREAWELEPLGLFVYARDKHADVPAILEPILSRNDYTMRALSANTFLTPNPRSKNEGQS